MLSIDIDVRVHFVHSYFNTGDMLLMSDSCKWFSYNTVKKEAKEVPFSISSGQAFKYKETLISLTGFKKVKWNAHKDCRSVGLNSASCLISSLPLIHSILLKMSQDKKRKTLFSYFSSGMATPTPSDATPTNIHSASNMRGAFNGLQALFLRDCPYAYYVHCFAHRLQLALVGAAEKQDYVWEFFSMLANVVNIVSGSSKRLSELQTAHGIEVDHSVASGERETGRGLNQIGNLQRAGSTRWNSHFNSVCSLIDKYGSIIIVLESINNCSTNSSAQRGEAREDMIITILSWLPAKSLLCFKTMSMAWLSLISNPAVINFHLRHAENSQDNESFIAHRTSYSYSSIFSGNNDSSIGLSYFEGRLSRDLFIVGSLMTLFVLYWTLDHGVMRFDLNNKVFYNHRFPANVQKSRGIKHGNMRVTEMKYSIAVVMNSNDEDGLRSKVNFWTVVDGSEESWTLT
ncbi:hypothetical protein POM88_024502 [Heracleum sosnowskyi]|uniref:Uncharacterized protein n=1 Tax=Heracleum sosnowskyi TaxID=360622 RepID=A0AAD8I4M3_9APIA|nr:hypothetical protein POM88_024502 [Heracleum sosnowskyi]